MHTTRTLNKQNTLGALGVTALTLAGAIALPFLAHLLPAIGNVPMGARLLPIFVAPLLALILLPDARGLLAALGAVARANA